jgi:hypothetical protein
MTRASVEILARFSLLLDGVLILNRPKKKFVDVSELDPKTQEVPPRYVRKRQMLEA